MIEKTWKVHFIKSRLVSHVRDRVNQMEKLLQEATVGCPGAADIWRGIRALMQTGEAPYLGIISNSTCVEVVQRKAVCKSIDEGLAELQEAKVSESAIGGASCRTICHRPHTVMSFPN